MTRPSRKWGWAWTVLAIALGALVVADSRPTAFVWRPLVVIAALTAATIGRRSNGLPLAFVGTIALIGVRVALADTGTTALALVGLSWVQAAVDAVLGVAIVGAAAVTLRSRRSQLGRRELLDGSTVAVGAALTAWITVANPALENGSNLVLAVGAAVHIPVAVMLLVLVLDFVLDGLARNRAIWLVLGAVTGNVVGSAGRALTQAGSLTSPTYSWLAAVFVVSFVLICAGIAHPDVREATVPPASRDRLTHHEAARILPLLGSLAVPVVLATATSATSTTDLVTRIVSVIVLVSLTVARLYVALEAMSKTQTAMLRKVNRDELTNLLTRPRFVDEVADILDSVWQSERHPTLIQLNIDRFKNINDTLGYSAANEVLIAIAGRLSSVAAPFGGIVARSGSDDFVIVDATTRTAVDAMARAQQVRETISAPVHVGDSTVFVTASIGVVIAPRNRTIASEELMRLVDIATHRAKSDGRNRTVLFDDSMRANLDRRMEIEHALHGAISRREMSMYYQPIVDITSGTLSGFEALIRWRRADGTLVSPAGFIPIAEETGLINELGAWAVKESLSALRRWIDDRIVPERTTMSVNVSPRQIADPGFAQVIRDAIDASRVDPELLWLEMTESMMLTEPELAQSTLREIRGMGVRLALDDFGTGYSSLSLLQQFPMQRIKIDRAFVNGIADRTNDRSLVRTIIAMGQSMGLDLVAEGVETIHQLHALRDLGCDKAQGFLISHPVPADALRSTMVAVGELASLAVFGSDGTSAPDAEAQFALTAASGRIGHLATRPLG